MYSATLLLVPKRPIWLALRAASMELRSLKKTTVFGVV